MLAPVRLLLETLSRLACRNDLGLALRFFGVQAPGQAGLPAPTRPLRVLRGRAEARNQLLERRRRRCLCPACAAADPLARELSLGALKVLRLLQRGSFADAAQVRVAGSLAQELERQLREYIRSVLERSVRSAAFLDTLRRRKAVHT